MMPRVMGEQLGQGAGRVVAAYRREVPQLEDHRFCVHIVESCDPAGACSRPQDSEGPVGTGACLCEVDDIPGNWPDTDHRRFTVPHTAQEVGGNAQRTSVTVWGVRRSIR